MCAIFPPPSFLGLSFCNFHHLYLMLYDTQIFIEGVPCIWNTLSGIKACDWTRLLSGFLVSVSTGFLYILSSLNHEAKAFHRYMLDYRSKNDERYGSCVSIPQSLSMAQEMLHVSLSFYQTQDTFSINSFVLPNSIIYRCLFRYKRTYIIYLFISQSNYSYSPIIMTINGDWDNATIARAAAHPVYRIPHI